MLCAKKTQETTHPFHSIPSLYSSIPKLMAFIIKFGIVVYIFATSDNFVNDAHSFLPFISTPTASTAIMHNTAAEPQTNIHTAAASAGAAAAAAAAETTTTTTVDCSKWKRNHIGVRTGPPGGGVDCNPRLCTSLVVLRLRRLWAFCVCSECVCECVDSSHRIILLNGGACEVEAYVVLLQQMYYACYCVYYVFVQSSKNLNNNLTRCLKSDGDN